MNELAAEKIRDVTLELALGPLAYHFIAHDIWGERVLASLSTYLDSPTIGKTLPDRVIHLYSLPQGPDNCKEDRLLPEMLASCLPSSEQDEVWTYCRNLVNTVWTSIESRHCFWTAGIDSQLGSFRYHLPWDLMLHDMARLNGGLIHGGLAEYSGSALLLLAPPGGGKSTTLATAPPDWRVLSDDAALIWPIESGEWLASPLPAWGMLNNNKKGPTSELRQLDHLVPIRTVIRLHHADEISLEPLSPAKSAPQIYRALREYPASFLADIVYRPSIFHTAAELARQLPCYRLNLTLHAPVWSRFETLLGYPA